MSLRSTAGYLALTYDPAGQGDSEGTSYALYDSRMAPCYIGGACREHLHAELKRIGFRRRRFLLGLLLLRRRPKPIDKPSMTILLAVVWLGEPLSWRLGAGVALMTIGALLTIS